MQLDQMNVLSFVDDEFEDLELWYPVYRLREEGVNVVFAGPEKGKKHIGKYGVPAVADLSYDEAHSADFDGLLVPGGWAPDKIRRYPKVLQLVREMDEAGKPIGQICHAGWVLISAKMLEGRKVTSTPGIRDDMENAGAEWLDEPVVVDGNLISARRPPDLPPYAKAFIDALKSKQRHS
ncbi:glutamine amidotransferase [Paenibacillus darwinianus]|uniref:Glutamine amidotransferase n=1 Tax=Paenibacillus darwinianus TaxID=1380763 RepID=A0A9W5S147_9BACL|nr:type 1 glutamine amidotransferase domain-containing protein [Paenibacillus darwinianus]EXX88108.1 glutamine amidotransferase [Paenibacillus darwinianus]EXX88292.1 glutamine amidotransferase [Paenibacillus darwinianus]EXX89908.1 glutamine amidotransferase [Paenibacillus darwinianus]